MVPDSGYPLSIYRSGIISAFLVLQDEMAIAICTKNEA
jgi:hypothetical protein